MHNVKMVVSKVVEKASGQLGRRDALCEALESKQKQSRPFLDFQTSKCDWYVFKLQNGRTKL